MIWQFHEFGRIFFVNYLMEKESWSDEKDIGGTIFFERSDCSPKMLISVYCNKTL